MEAGWEWIETETDPNGCGRFVDPPLLRSGDLIQRVWRWDDEEMREVTVGWAVKRAALL